MNNEDIQRKFTHDLSNKIMAIYGKVKVMNIRDSGNEDLLKIESYCDEALKILRGYKDFLDGEDNE